MPHVTPHLARLKFTRARRRPNRHQQHPRSLHQAACCFDNGAPAPASPRHSSASHAPRHRRYVAPHAARLKLTHDCRHRSHCQQSATLRCRIQHPASSLVRCRLSRPHQVSCPCNYLIAADSHAAHRPLVLKTTENLTAASALSGSGAPSGDLPLRRLLLTSARSARAITQGAGRTEQSTALRRERSRSTSPGERNRGPSHAPCHMHYVTCIMSHRTWLASSQPFVHAGHG